MFDFNSIYEAKSIQDAIEALHANPNARIIAGGTDVLVAMRDGVGVGGDWVSIKGVEELRGITLDENENIHIRPCTTFREIKNSDIIRKRIPYFIEATETIGSPQIRTMATLGGNISNGFTTADAPPTLLALGADAVVTGPKGSRSMPIEKYYVKPEVMDLKLGELLTDVVIPGENYKGYAGNYIKYAIRDAMDIALLGVAVVVKPNEAKTHIDDIKIAFGAAAGIPIRAWTAEEKLRGAKIEEALFEAIGQHCTDDISPITCKRATKEFRIHLTTVLPGRALKKALCNSGAW